MTEREETIDLLVAAVRRFAREQLIPAEREVEETDDIPDRKADACDHPAEWRCERCGFQVVLG